MDILYARREVTVNDLQAALPDPPAHTAVRTMLKILGDKGLVKRRKIGREYCYEPRTERTREGRSALRRVLQTFFDGSLENAVGAYLAQKNAGVSEEELQRLRHMIEEAEKRRD
jgi:BlaI family transcriptional regulator, penicillinase repressor